MRTLIHEMSVDETFDLIQYAIDHPEVLLAELNGQTTNTEHILQKMMAVVRAAMNDEDFYDPPGDMEVANLIKDLVALPFYILKYDNDDVWNISAAIVLLASNYTKLYPNEALEQTLAVIYTLFAASNKLQLLIFAADSLLQRCEQWSNSQIDLYGISESFTQNLLNKPRKED